jgi:multicomponent Na+:H+ antiporter subunit D
MASTAAAVALAALALFRKRLPAAWRRRTTRVFQPAVFGLRNLHSGHVGDYTAWLVVGLSVLGGLFIVATR